MWPNLELSTDFITFIEKSFMKNFLCSMNEKSYLKPITTTAQKMKFSIKDFISECNQIRSFLQIW